MLRPAKKGAFLLIFVLVCSCQTYNNFRAYYNTYYNAKKSFNKGLEKVKDQPFSIDPDQFISIYPVTSPDGERFFEDAIANAAQIIRRFPNSKWFDKSLLLIGKSNYLLNDYYKALEKFEAIITLKKTSDRKQKAAIWKSRALFALGRHKEAVRFLNEQLASHQTGWNSIQKAELKISLANHLAKVNKLRSATIMLQSSIAYVDQRNLQARAYFLLGQLFSKLGEHDKAYQAFYTAEKQSSHFELGYYSKVKAAQSVVLAGRGALANSIYAGMLSDDKYYNRRYHIMYHLGYVAEQRDEYRHAALIYKQILKNAPEAELKSLSSDIYFRLSQIYSRRFNNYQLAAAYLDSSKSSAQKKEVASAKAFEKYITLKAQIAQIDSLLWLADLPAAALDSVLEKIRSKSAAKQFLAKNDNVASNNKRKNLARTQPTYFSSFGFLNYRDEQLVAQGIHSFKAVWGGRALVDNWRRIEASPNISKEAAENKAGLNGQNLNAKERRQVEKIDLIADIPFTPQEKEQKYIQKNNLQYRLANLFFLTLDKPDSAAYYYQKVIGADYKSVLVPKALYSLYKLYLLESNTERAQYYKAEILQKYSNTIYANSLIGRAKPDSVKLLRRSFYSIIRDSLSTIIRAHKLEQLALDNPGSPLASQIYFISIKEYIKAAKSLKDSTSSSKKYSGERWEKVLKMVEDFDTRFPKSEVRKQVEHWKKMLKSKQHRYTCKELKVTPQILGGMKAFIEKIIYPPQVEALGLNGTLTYQILIGKRGEVKSFELISNPSGLGIEETYSRAIKKYLHFDPVLHNGNPVQISCLVTLSIKK